MREVEEKYIAQSETKVVCDHKIVQTVKQLSEPGNDRFGYLQNSRVNI